jgi:hypothetical protein
VEYDADGIGVGAGTLAFVPEDEVVGNCGAGIAVFASAREMADPFLRQDKLKFGPYTGKGETRRSGWKTKTQVHTPKLGHPTHFSGLERVE